MSTCPRSLSHLPCPRVPAASLTSLSLGMYAAGVATATAGLAILGRSSADERDDEVLEELPGVMEVRLRSPEITRDPPEITRDHARSTRDHARSRVALSHSRAVHPKRQSTMGPSHSCAHRRDWVDRERCRASRRVLCGRAAGCGVENRLWLWALDSRMRYSRRRCADRCVCSSV